MKRAAAKIFAVVLLTFLIACAGSAKQSAIEQTPAPPVSSPSPPARNTSRLIHALVALCDNHSQGIVPVPAKIGNGDDPANNLYWGAAFGVKNFFKRSGDWRLIAEKRNPKAEILERIVFKHQTKDAYLVADAYRGREIKKCLTDFFEFAAGRNDETISLNSSELRAGGGADLIAYIGHDGLMDFSLDSDPRKSDDRRRDAIILACFSKDYFAKPLGETGANPLLWTTGLMAPEAYVLKAALDGWLLDENGERIRRRAAAAYNQHQRCGSKAALRLFASGW